MSMSMVCRCGFRAQITDADLNAVAVLRVTDEWLRHPHPGPGQETLPLVTAEDLTRAAAQYAAGE
jgi:hypothetical protein